MTLRMTTLRVVEFCILTFSMMALIATLGINDTSLVILKMCYSVLLDAEYIYVIAILPNVVMLTVQFNCYAECPLTEYVSL
jgi:hypothetical protein